MSTACRCYEDSCIHFHLVGHLYAVYCFALGYGGLAQLLAGMWEARRGKMFAATVLSSYGAFWISLGLFGIFSDVRPAPMNEGPSCEKAYCFSGGLSQHLQ